MKTSESIGDRKARRGKATGHSTRERGVVLILVILAMTALSALAAAIVCTVQADTLASYNYELTTQRVVIQSTTICNRIAQAAAWALRSPQVTAAAGCTQEPDRLPRHTS